MNGDKVASPRKATSPQMAPVKVSSTADDDDVPISSFPKTPAGASSPKVASVKPDPEDEDDKPLSSKAHKVTSPKHADAAAVTPKLEDDDKPLAATANSSALPSKVSPASTLAVPPPSRVVSSSTPTSSAPDLQSILSKVKALAAQSAANVAAKSSRPASQSTSTKRSKTVHTSDDDDDEPLSARGHSSAKPHSSSKHVSSHSSHDKKKKDHDRSSPSRSRNSGALLGDAGSEVKSIGHVFLSSDRSDTDKIIAGILSRWWCVPPAVCVLLRCASRVSATDRYGIEWPPASYQPTVDKTWKPLVGFSFV